MKQTIGIFVLTLSILLMQGCSPKPDAEALEKAGLSDYVFTMVQGANPEPGKPLIIEFWATWCGPCHRLFPHLNQLAEELEGTDIQFIAVTNEPFNLTKEFVTVRKLKYPVASDIQDVYGRAFNVSYIPFAVILNADGQVVWSGHSGKLSRRRIENELAPKS